MPTRGNARKIGIRVEARPGVVPAPERRVGDSASRSGTCTRIPLATWIALSGSSMPTWTCSAEDDLLARDEAQRVDQLAVARPRDDPLVLPERERMRAGRADRTGPRSPATSRTVCRSARSCAPASARVRARRGRDLEHRLHQLGLDLALGAYSSSSASIALTSVERLVVEDHQLLLDAERVAWGPLNFGLHRRA